MDESTYGGIKTKTKNTAKYIVVDCWGGALIGSGKKLFNEKEAREKMKAPGSWKICRVYEEDN